MATLDLPILHCVTPADWSAWLAENGTDSRGVFLRIGKKGGLASVTYDEALDEALCHGWIDGQRRAHDDVSFLQRFTPRSPRSVWSKRNVQKVADLTAAGRMRPGGIAEVEKAKANGRWDAAYDGSATAEVPADLQAAIDASPAAAAAFATLGRQNRFALLFRTQSAVRAETRAKRIRQFVEMLERGETIY